MVGVAPASVRTLVTASANLQFLLAGMKLNGRSQLCRLPDALLSETARGVVFLGTAQ